jgi:hypothetical protein
MKAYADPIYESAKRRVQEQQEQTGSPSTLPKPLKKTKLDNPAWFGTLEGEHDGKPFFALLLKSGEWACLDPTVGGWLVSVGRVLRCSRADLYGTRAAAMLAAQRYFGGKLTMITRRGFKE